MEFCGDVLKDGGFLLNEANGPSAEVLEVFLEALERFTGDSLFIIMPLTHLFVQAIISRTQRGMNNISIWHRLFPHLDVSYISQLTYQLTRVVYSIKYNIVKY